MKIHEFAQQLELLTKLLRQLPDTELDESFISIIRPVFSKIGPESEKQPPRKESTRMARPLPVNVENQLVDKSPAEIEAFLASEYEGFTVSNLLELAKRLGIAASKRQNKSALINLITRHFEAEQMHSIIRGARQDDT